MDKMKIYLIYLVFYFIALAVLFYYLLSISTNHWLTGILAFVLLYVGKFDMAIWQELKNDQSF